MHDSVSMVHPPMDFDCEPELRIQAHEVEELQEDEKNVYGASPSQRDYDEER